MHVNVWASPTAPEFVNGVPRALLVMVEWPTAENKPPGTIYDCLGAKKCHLKVSLMLSHCYLWLVCGRIMMSFALFSSGGAFLKETMSETCFTSWFQIVIQGLTTKLHQWLRCCTRARTIIYRKRAKHIKQVSDGGLAKSVSGVSLTPPGCQKCVKTCIWHNFVFLLFILFGVSNKCSNSIKIVSGRAFGPSQTQC